MKKVTKKAVTLIMAIAMALSFALTSSAAFKTVDGTTYLVNQDGSVGEKYTGWARSNSTGNRFYFEDGVRVTGVFVMNGVRYVFDDKGVLIGSRNSANEDYTVMVGDDDYNLSLADLKDAGQFSIDVKINNPGDIAPEAFGGETPFALFKYENGSWKTIPRQPYNAAWAYRPQANEDYVLTLSMPAAYFDLDALETGLYRVRAKVWYEDGGPDVSHGTYTTKSVTESIVRGEFNLVK